LVWKADRWKVAGPESAGVWSEISRLASAGTARATGSLTTSSPAAIVTDPGAGEGDDTHRTLCGLRALGRIRLLQREGDGAESERCRAEPVGDADAGGPAADAGVHDIAEGGAGDAGWCRKAAASQVPVQVPVRGSVEVPVGGAVRAPVRGSAQVPVRGSIQVTVRVLAMEIRPPGRTSPRRSRPVGRASRWSPGRRGGAGP